jgi:hypothetical protein
MELIYVQDKNYQVYVDIYEQPKGFSKEKIQKDVMDRLCTVISWHGITDFYKGYTLSIDKVKMYQNYCLSIELCLDLNETKKD